MHRQRIRFARPPRSIQLRAAIISTPNGIQRQVQPVDTEQVARQQKLHQENEQVSRLLDDLRQVVEELEQRRSQSLHELQQIAVELAVMAASHVVYAELERDGLGVENLVAQAIAELPLNSVASVRLNPQDLALLNARTAKESVPWNRTQIQLVADGSISRGGLHLETEAGRILLSDVVSRLSEVRQQWMENIDDTQIERRRVQENSESLRRFPDRRETA
ncbi:MAG: FliH/SctL family protein [Planctomycetaceae bacterium]